MLLRHSRSNQLRRGSIPSQFAYYSRLATAGSGRLHIDVLADLFLERGSPEFIRSDNGPEFIATELRRWFEVLTVAPLYIQKGSPWENGYIESFNGKLRDEFLNGEIFYTLLEAKVLIERWRIYYNTKRPHSSLGYKPPAPATVEFSKKAA